MRTKLLIVALVVSNAFAFALLALIAPWALQYVVLDSACSEIHGAHLLYEPLGWTEGEWMCRDIPNDRYVFVVSR